MPPDCLQAPALSFRGKTSGGMESSTICHNAQKLSLSFGSFDESLGNSALVSGGRKDYNPQRTQGKEADETMSDFSNVTVFEPEQVSDTRILLDDEDFAYYYWTLPFCNY